MRLSAFVVGHVLAALVTVLLLLKLMGQWLFMDFFVDNLYAPYWLTLVFAAVAIVGMYGFAISPRLRTLPLLAIGAAALMLCGVSMRTLGTPIPGGIYEMWGGSVIQDAAWLPGNYCYRIDRATFELRGGPRNIDFIYRRGIWPTAFDEAQLTGLVGLPVMKAGGDGWRCQGRDEELAPAPRH